MHKFVVLAVILAVTACSKHDETKTSGSESPSVAVVMDQDVADALKHRGSDGRLPAINPGLYDAKWFYHVFDNLPSFKDKVDFLAHPSDEHWERINYLMAIVGEEKMQQVLTKVSRGFIRTYPNGQCEIKGRTGESVIFVGMMSSVFSDLNDEEKDKFLKKFKGAKVLAPWSTT